MISQRKLDKAISSLNDDQAKWLRTYVAEAVFFGDVLADDFAALPAGAAAVEIGSGIGLLSMLAASRGLRVTSVEPESAGFGDMRLFRELVREAWEGPEPDVEWVDGRVEDLPVEPAFAYAFAINVVEHVESPAAIIDETVSRLAHRRIFRLICPNYHFPYEPHFNIPTLISKRLTAAAMASRISAAELTDAQGLWDELSWPTAHGIRVILRERGWAYKLTADATAAYIDRSLSDPSFGARKGPVTRGIGAAAARLPRRVVDAVPTTVLPIIDARVCNYREDVGTRV